MTTEMPRPLPVDQLRQRCDPKQLSRAGQQLHAGSSLVGQDRGLSALRLAVDIRHADFNLFVVGPEGTGRHTAVQEILKERALSRETPEDLAYVNNFDEPRKPVALRLPAGAAERLKAEMVRVVNDLANDIPELFESEEYRTQRRIIDEEFGTQQEEAMADFTNRARAEDIALLRTPMGFMVAAIRDGHVVKTEEFNKLPEEDQKVIEEKIARFQDELQDVLAKTPKLEREHRNRIEMLNGEMAKRAVSGRIDEARETLGDAGAAADFLSRVHDDMVENPELFLQAKSERPDGPFPEVSGKAHLEPLFRRYMVNVMVGHQPAAPEGAPVVVEDLPTFDRLVGRIEHVSQMGSLVTDFTLIRPGALHRANGGYLVLDARRVLSEPFAWDALKRSIKEQSITITSLAERVSLFSTTSLEPDSIPLDVRVVLVGDRFLYALLVMLDPDVQELFKVQADFEENLGRNDETLGQMALLLHRYAEKEELLPVTPDALACLLDESSRLAEDATKLSLRLGTITDILREAEHYSRANDRKEVLRQDVEQAVTERDRRASRVRDRVREAITRQTIMIDTDGKKVGQINGLSVYELGRFRFGRPSRITARVRMGTGKLIDIEREVELGGPLHSKGVMILSGYLTTTYACDMPFSLHASLVFEQSYGGIEGDSASCAELIALLSALSELELRQDVAITGSVNQLGQVQAIGGVNEKIEGFFDICAERGLTGDQAVLIPAANIDHLMLRERVTDAVEAGKFSVIPITTVDEAVALMTGVPAGARGDDGTFPENGVNARVEARLREFAAMRKSFASRAAAGDEGEQR
ncbi:Lon protease family protein [Jannaschia seohaensis]|uniref:endopeptidase La n=1 Tax=Jannaschia seohaensis TaxID=475081 RepID=A0A2Y9C225_9RHOB|nr:ATP-binding protein [Jannaschia seohaensis]PWJ16120.1 putative ATP-dependent protease [Jannaschia seohaensis]SSA48982.1 Predicted ATP-dependent protease [Jannaschia seohaensis]